MVVKELTRQLALSVSHGKSEDSGNHGRISDRMGNSAGKPEVERDMERTREVETHQRTRTTHSPQSTENDQLTNRR